MNLNQRRQLAQVAFLSLMVLGAGTAISQTERPVAGPGKGIAPALTERVDLSEVSRASQDVSRFLAQPKLAEALAKAKSDKAAGGEASQNANAYLAKEGVQVPGNMKVLIDTPAVGGIASKIKWSITYTCCPSTITIKVSW